MKLHVGCGFDKLEGYINCDFSKEVKPDKNFDITKKWPFKNNQVTEIIMNHTLEHTQKPIDVMKEMYRICKNEAIIKIRVPYFSSESAFSMMDHYSFYSYTTFDFLEENHPCHWQGVGNFKIIQKKLIWRKELKIFEFIFGRFPRIYQELFCWIFPAKELYIELKVIK
ncbi:MAG TPA: methyltransferase domain-containing protein [archaeon]|nr:methyltransferase domain-containing protein [archaeon]